MAPLVAAAPYISAASSVMQFTQQGAIGKYNQAANNRAATVLEGQAAQIEQKAEFDIAQFNKNYQKVKGETRVSLAKSGVQIGSGSAYNIALSNALEAKLQENLIRYNSQVAAANKREEASFARIKGSIARQEARLAQIGTIASAGTTLLTMSNFSTPNTTGSYGNRGTGMSGYGGGADRF